MSDPREGLWCPECSAPFEQLTLYVENDGPYYGCDECGWLEPHGPGVWTVEKIAEVLDGSEEPA